MPTPTSFTSNTTLMAPVVAAINHLLAQEPWAREALALHAGKEACIDSGALKLRLLAGRDGLVEASAADTPANVTIHVKLADLPLIAQNPERAFSFVRIEGDAEFANTISQLGKGLRWEAEHDLEPWIGPIAATRLVGGAKDAFDTARATHRKVSENLAEFFLEEQPLLVRPAMVEGYGNEVSRLRDDVERAAKRLAKLEAKLAQRGAQPEPSGNAQQQLDI
jgi:ubiquinone biosynthesis protein UbiJ